MTPAEPIAVVGLACRLPGADTPAALAALLRDGRQGVGPIPPARWALWEDGGTPAKDRVRARGAGTLDGIDLFDRHPFRISATEAPLIDPQQRLVLETGWHAIEDAGLSPACLDELPVGVFVGVGASDYAMRMAKGGIADRGSPHLPNGAQNGAVAGRLSYCLGLTGPSMAIDTACSSALAAVAQAGDALRLGHCDLALAGGVSALLSADGFAALAATGVLSATGETRSFDAAAGGFVRAEGCGMVAMKRLSDACADGDRIHAVLPGWATGQDGRSNGLSAPSRRAQARVVAQALRAAGAAPGDVGAIEAHGSATALGDVIEMAALADVFAGRAGPPVAVGSVKAAVGHLEAAAGIAGLIKAILMVRDGFVPVQPAFDAPSPRIPWEALPFEVPRATRDWPGLRRVAGVSAFGMSGLNAHVVVAAWDEERPQPAAKPGPHLFLLSAATPQALSTRADQLLTALAAPGADLGRLAGAVTRRWAGMGLRAGFLASSVEEARDATRQVLSAPTRPAAPSGEPDLGCGGEPSPAALLALHEAGAAIRPHLACSAEPEPPDLPGYPFVRQRHWYDDVPGPGTRRR